MTRELRLITALVSDQPIGRRGSLTGFSTFSLVMNSAVRIRTHVSFSSGNTIPRADLRDECRLAFLSLFLSLSSYLSCSSVTFPLKTFASHFDEKMSEGRHSYVFLSSSSSSSSLPERSRAGFHLLITLLHIDCLAQ